ncbi:MAG: helix-turn-helix domain-containing protein [Propionibacteriales bacterium]|nr:helix-turn-helix domain-containing protein [Propionibacteriales bacterium]
MPRVGRPSSPSGGWRSTEPAAGVMPSAPAGQSLYRAEAMSLLFRAEDEPASSQAERARQVVAEAMLPAEIRSVSGAAPIPGRIVTGTVGAVRVTELTSCPPGEAVRTPRMIRRHDPEHYRLDVVVHGNAVIEQDGRAARVGAGDLTVVDSSRPARWAHASTPQVVTASFPRAMLSLRQDEVAELTAVRIPGTEGAGALVSALARQLPKQVDTYSAAEGARLGAALIDLVAATLAGRIGTGSRLAPEPRQQVLLRSIHAFIEQRLADQRLTPATIAAAHHISVRYLHKLFETQDTTVAAWVRRRRLERCHRDLLDPALQGRPVSAIAARWGLTNPRHFSRAFRSVYGVPPGEYRLTYNGSTPR